MVRYEILLERAANEIMQKFEDEIVRRLTEHGHTFENKEELYVFARTRMEMAEWMNSTKRVVFVDGSPLFEFEDKFTTEIVGNKMIVSYG